MNTRGLPASLLIVKKALCGEPVVQFLSNLQKFAGCGLTGSAISSMLRVLEQERTAKHEKNRASQ
jgi:hypothetical protein